MLDSPPLQGLRSPREVLPFDDFPPDDLLDTLVELFFRKVNDLLPLLHEPTFKNDIRDGLHRRDGGFGAVVLLVCAGGARYSSDSRVLLDGSDDWRSPGWKWFHAVEDRRKLSLAPAQLYDLQICAVSATDDFAAVLLLTYRGQLLAYGKLSSRYPVSSDGLDYHWKWSAHGCRCGRS